MIITKRLEKEIAKRRFLPRSCEDPDEIDTTEDATHQSLKYIAAGKGTTISCRSDVFTNVYKDYGKCCKNMVVGDYSDVFLARRFDGYIKLGNYSIIETRGQHCIDQLTRYGIYNTVEYEYSSDFTENFVIMGGDYCQVKVDKSSMFIVKDTGILVNGNMFNFILIGSSIKIEPLVGDVEFIVNGKLYKIFENSIFEFHCWDGLNEKIIGKAYWKYYTDLKCAQKGNERLVRAIA